MYVRSCDGHAAIGSLYSPPTNHHILQVQLYSTRFPILFLQNITLLNMSQAVSEIAILPLHPGVNLESGEDKQILDDTLATIAKQHGFKNMYWGLKVEDPSVLQMVISTYYLPKFSTFPDLEFC
jgi:hypothetical protein